MKLTKEQTYGLIRWAYRHLTHLELFNEEILPKDGPMILAVNHMSRLDFPVLIRLQRYRDVVPLAADTYRSYPVMGQIIDSIGSIWIDRSQADFSAIRAAMNVLKEGKILTIAPEGTRSRVGQLIEAKGGVTLLAARTNAPIYTLSITGTEDFAQQFARLRRPRIKGYFGPAVTLPPMDRDDREGSTKRQTDEVMCRIAAMLPEKYRGFYRDYPRVAELAESYKAEGALQLPQD